MKVSTALRALPDLVVSEALLVTLVTWVHKDALETKVNQDVRVRRALRALSVNLVQLDRKDSKDLKDLLDNLEQLVGLDLLDRPVSESVHKHSMLCYISII